MAKKPTAPRAAATPAPVIDAPAIEDAPVTETPVTAASAPEPIPAIPNVFKGIQSMFTSKIDFAAVGKENYDALTASSKIWAEGVQEIGKQAAASAKASFEESVAMFKALTTVKSVKEAIELQTTYTKTATAKALAESTKLSEASMKLTEQALAPLTARVAAAVSSFSKAA